MEKQCKNCQHFWNIKGQKENCILPQTKNKNNLNKVVKSTDTCNDFMQSQWK
jgi:hypothetical protein